MSEQKIGERSPYPSGNAPVLNRGIRTLGIVIVFVLATIIGGGLFWLFVLGSGAPVGAGWYLFAYAAGLSRLHFLPFIVIFAGVGVVPTLFGVSLGALIIGGGNTFWLAGLAVALSLVTLCGIALFGYLANRHDISAVESAKDSSEEYADR